MDSEGSGNQAPVPAETNLANRKFQEMLKQQFAVITCSITPGPGTQENEYFFESSVRYISLENRNEHSSSIEEQSNTLFGRQCLNAEDGNLIDWSGGTPGCSNTDIHPAETLLPPEDSQVSQGRRRFVLCPSLLTKNQMSELESFCKVCDGTISREFNLSVTHVVMNTVNGRVPQTFKYLMGIAAKIWVVMFHWIEQCVSSQDILSEEEYETSKLRYGDPGPRRARLSHGFLFSRFAIYVTPEGWKAIPFTQDQFKVLIKTLGGRIVDAPEQRYKDLLIIGSLDGDIVQYRDWLNTKYWLTVTVKWLLECIVNYELKPLKDNYVCSDTTNVNYIVAVNRIKDLLSRDNCVKPIFC